ncbi:MAG: hypothetical protein RMA76_17970 [Deltaproteobacteria bacterium]|jgi:hypothetical protein
MTIDKLPRREVTIGLADVSFPEKLLEALGPAGVTRPEVNPVARHEAVRFVNGLSRRSGATGGFGPPPETAHRREAIEAFLAGADRGGVGEPERRLIALLEERRQDVRGVQVAMMQNGLTTREI